MKTQLETPFIEIWRYADNGASFDVAINHQDKSIYLYDWKSENSGNGHFRKLLNNTLHELKNEYPNWIITVECENQRSANIAAYFGKVVKSLIMYEL